MGKDMATNKIAHKVSNYGFEKRSSGKQQQQTARKSNLRSFDWVREEIPGEKAPGGCFVFSA